MTDAKSQNDSTVLFVEHNDVDTLSKQQVSSVSKNFTCQICRYQFSSKTGLNLHYSCHVSKELLYVCEACGDSFPEAQDYADHFAVKHCDFETERNETSNRSIPKLYSCITCDLYFTDKIEFDDHQYSHNLNASKYTCEICDHILESGSELRAHYKMHKRKLHVCKICRKCFKFKSSLMRHALTHREAKPYQCEICKSGFTQNVSLQKHYLIHENIKPYHCKLCNKSFTAKVTLEMHMVKHTGVKPYSCLICDDQFFNKRGLKRHGLEHMPGQRSVCDVCGKVFSTKGKLKLHYLVHTNERPYRCNICSRGFTYSSHLKRHILWHRGEKPYACKMCDAAFITNFGLKRHYIQNHNGLSDQDVNNSDLVNN